MEKETILKKLEFLAAKLGVAVGHLWGVLNKQCYVMCLRSSLFYFSLACSAFIFSNAIENRVCNYLCYVLAIIFFVQAVIEILQVINPEYQVIKEIMQALGAKDFGDDN